MSNVIDLFKNNKRFQYTAILSVIALFCIVLNITFSAFTRTTNKNAANIKVGNLSYSTAIDGNTTSIIEATNNKITKKNVFLISNNNLDTKYELTYEVCTDSSCTETTTKPENFKVEYSSKTIDSVKDTIGKTSTKIIRLIITNDTDTTYYIKLGVNAGFAYNTLVYKNQITEEYPEDDLTVISYINGVKNNAFPTSEDYTPIVECNNGATGSAAWDGTQWLLTVSNFTETDTKCHIDFAKNPGNWLNASNTTLLGLIKENNPLKHTLTKPAQEINLSTEALLSYTPDDYTSTAGNSYYFRGNVQNNYVTFANKCWKIVRVDGNGNIKLFLWNNNGTDCTTNAADTSTFNADSLKYTKDVGGTGNLYQIASGVGFMYGKPDSTELFTDNNTGAQDNINDSTILINLKTWYDNTFDTANTTNYTDLLADVIWCGDKSVGSGDGDGYGTASTYFMPLRRVYLNNPKTPSLVCPDASTENGVSETIKNTSRYTAYSNTDSNNTNGNGMLKSAISETNPTEYKYYKIGLLTADEAAYAGGKGRTENNSYYLYTGSYYWTMSPLGFNNISQLANVWYVYSTGNLFGTSVRTTGGDLRPAISLNYNVQATYNTSSEDAPGTVNNPYEIVIP